MAAAEDQRHTDELMREVGLEPHPPEPSRAPDPRPWTTPGAADYAAVFKAPPTEAQFAAHRARTQKAGPPPKPPPCGWAWRPDAQLPAGASAAAGSSELTAPKLPPAKPPPGSTSTLPPEHRARLEAAVAAGEAAARALALAEAGWEPILPPPALASALQQTSAPEVADHTTDQLSAQTGALEDRREAREESAAAKAKSGGK